MNWINSVVRPKLRGLLTTKREPPDDFWKQCPDCGQMLDHKALEDNLWVFPCCEAHGRVGAETRLTMLFDGGVFEKIELPAVKLDPLKFKDHKKYTDRLKDAKATTALDDAILVVEGMLDDHLVVAAAQDFRFMAGSLGMAAGDAIIEGMMHAVKRKAPFVLFAASGGARMQEGILSLMQLPRTTIGIHALRKAGLPYIVVLCDPTTGGVTASYAMLGDIHIAEPGALICFAGPRVIEQTIREQLPEGFQRSEYLLEHGMIDMVVHRKDMRQTLAKVCTMLMSGIAATKGKDNYKDKAADDIGIDDLKVTNGHLNGSAIAPAAVSTATDVAATEIIIDEPIADMVAMETTPATEDVPLPTETLNGTDDDHEAILDIKSDASAKTRTKKAAPSTDA